MTAARKLRRAAAPRVSAAQLLRLVRFPAIRGAISEGLKREVPKEVTIPRDGRYVRFTIRPGKDRGGRSLWVKELFSTIPIGSPGTRAVIGTMRADVKKPGELRRFLSKLRGASDAQRRSYIYQMRRAGIIGGSKTQAVLVPKQRVMAAVAKYTGRRVAANPILATLGIRPNPSHRSNPKEKWAVYSTGVRGRTVRAIGPYKYYEFPMPPGRLSEHGSQGAAERAAARYARKYQYKLKPTIFRDERGERAKPNKSGGYYVMTYGGGRYTSVAWHPTKAEAQRHVNQLKAAGLWSGMPPKVESAGRKAKANPTRWDDFYVEHYVPGRKKPVTYEGARDAALTFARQLSRDKRGDVAVIVRATEDIYRVYRGGKKVNSNPRGRNPITQKEARKLLKEVRASRKYGSSLDWDTPDQHRGWEAGIGEAMVTAGGSRKVRRAGRKLINRALDNRGRRARGNPLTRAESDRVRAQARQHYNAGIRNMKRLKDVKEAEAQADMLNGMYQAVKATSGPYRNRTLEAITRYQERLDTAVVNYLQKQRTGRRGKARRNPSAEIPRINIPFRDGQKVTPAAVRNWLRALPNSRIKTMLSRRFEQNMKQYRKFHLGAEPKHFMYKSIPMGASKNVTDVDFVTSEGKEWSANYQVPEHSGKFDPSVEGRYIHSHGESGINVDIKRPAKRSKLPERFHTADGKFVGVIPSRNVKITDWYRG